MFYKVLRKKTKCKTNISGQKSMSVLGSEY